MKRAALALALALTGCNTAPVWEKPGASDAEFRADLGDCQSQVIASGARGIQMAMAHRACMHSRGWREQ